MNININSEDIENHIKKSIIESSIGINIKKCIKEIVEKSVCSYDSVLKKAVEQCVREIVIEILNEPENRKHIHEAIFKAFDGKVIEEITTQAAKYLLDIR